MKDRDALRRGLLDWYDKNRRVLPWRADRPDPYRVWLSEIMLQQTTVPHATPYFLEFAGRWPTVGALAAAKDEDVMAAWAGLGYYARARNLLKCARVVATECGGRFPDTEEALRQLPGIGAYTAAAIAAIAFDRPANVVDGNVERVMARLFAVGTPLPAAKPELTALAASLVTGERPGDWAQALMDLGAMICRPKAPLCDRCPLAAQCEARRHGQQETFPRRSPKAGRPRRFGVAYVLLRAGSEVALVRRPPKGLLGGMLALPTTEWKDAPPVVRPGPQWREAGEIEHVFTHFSLTLRVLKAEGDRPGEWLPVETAMQALPSVFRKALKKAL